MSAPNTNLDKQKRRHWGPLVGMAVVVIFGIVMIVFWLGEEAVQSDPPSPNASAPVETLDTAPATEGTLTPEAAPQQTAPAP